MNCLHCFKTWGKFFFLAFLSIAPLSPFTMFPADLYAGDGGFKYFRNYTPGEYNHQPQNWSVLQDPRGMIYVGNHEGVMEYDGVSWRIINIPNWSVLSMAMDDTGTVYVGGKNELGYLSPGSEGTLEYKSLLPYIEEGRRDFSSVWSTHVTKEGIYFHSLKYLFRWEPASRRMKAWESGNLLVSSFSPAGRLFIRHKELGLMQMKGDTPQVVPGGKTFAGKKIYMMVPFDTGAREFLVGTQSDGLYLYDGVKTKQFPCEPGDYLRKNRLTHGIRLRSGGFALATRRGLAVIDSAGKILYYFNKTHGLQDDSINFIHEDSGGNLWLALDNGISKIEYSSAFSIYDERNGLSGITLSIARHGQNQTGALYAGTTKGLFVYRGGEIKNREGRNREFRRLTGITGTCWAIASIDRTLLAAASSGVFQVQEGGAARAVMAKSCFALTPSRKEPTRAWAGTRHGLIALRLVDGKWTKEHEFKTIGQPVRTVVEDSRGSLWLGTLTRGVIKVDFPADIVYPVITRYDASHGLPSQEINVFYAAGHVMFATDKGIFRFDEKAKLFVPDDTLGKEFADGSLSVFRIAEDKRKHIWLHAGLKNIQAIPGPGGAYQLNAVPFLRLPDDQVNAVYPDPASDTVWFSGHHSLIRFQPIKEKKYREGFPCWIRRVELMDGKIPVFNGYRSPVPSKIESPPVFSYKEGNLRIKFAAPFFEAEKRTQYRFILEGYKNKWSSWTSETKKDYTNLYAGEYSFRVQAKNVYGKLSREAVFPFQVLPPWYLTWWMVSFYVLGFLLIVYLAVRWRSRHLEKDKLHLGQVIEERTKEIAEKNRQLEEQTVRLKKQSGQLEELNKAKSRFFANISHEFRTPLTLIMGPLEQIISTYPDEELKNSVGLMLRNSQRLLALVDQLLELAKLDHGKLTLRASHQNIVGFLKTFVTSFDSLAVQCGLELTFHSQEEDIRLYFDPEKIEKIMGNLLANALKFTPSGGTITVSAKTGTGDEFPGGFLDISVRDTGIGIPADQLPHIFDRFFQADRAYPREHSQKGSGIGLALTNELVCLHHGVITVQSSTGGNGEPPGTEFFIRLPMGDTHLTPGEMAGPTGKESAGTFSREPYEDFSLMEKIEGIEKIDGPDRVGEEEKEGGGDAENIILVVEDSADMRNYIRGSLEPAFRVTEAADGEEGLKKALEIVPDLIISDVMMPGMDGYELCKELKNHVNTSHIPIILLTARASEDNILEGLETGADDYITKPFSTKILAVRCRNLIDLRRQLQLKRKRQMKLQPAEISVSSVDETFLKELREIIEKNLPDPEFNIEQLCKKLLIGRTTLYRKIMALTGEKPTEFIRSYRLKRAAQLLKARYGNITEVAFAAGFSNTAYFTRCFKEMFHQSPSAYQSSETRNH